MDMPGLEDYTEPLKTRFLNTNLIINHRKSTMTKDVSNSDHDASFSIVRKFLDRAEMLEDNGKFEEAIACCDEAINAGPWMDASYNFKAMLLARVGRFKEALYGDLS